MGIREGVTYRVPEVRGVLYVSVVGMSGSTFTPSTEEGTCFSLPVSVCLTKETGVVSGDGGK